MLRPTGVLVQVVRSSMITALSSAYVKTARAKGVSGTGVVFVHALRNAMLPVITVASDQAAGIVNGAVIVETVFGFPGIGNRPDAWVGLIYRCRGTHGTSVA